MQIVFVTNVTIHPLHRTLPVCMLTFKYSACKLSGGWPSHHTSLSGEARGTQPDGVRGVVQQGSLAATSLPLLVGVVGPDPPGRAPSGPTRETFIFPLAVCNIDMTQHRPGDSPSLGFQMAS